MTLLSDHLVDRRRLRRQVSVWRILAFGIAMSAVIAGGIFATRGRSIEGAHVARIAISGLITGKQETLDLLKQVETSPAKAVILRINSGGGTTSGSEALFTAIRELAGKKPVVAVIDGVGASGAYMAAMGADRIIANGSAIVGSIGVIAQFPNVSKLLDTIGVKMEAVRSSPLKAMPSGVEPTDPAARKALEDTVLDTYHWFRDLVGERRALEGQSLTEVTDGRVFTGRQALKLKLIDSLGGEAEARAWLAVEKKIDTSLAIRDYKPRSERRGIPGLTSLTAGLSMLGLADAEPSMRALEQKLGPLMLDGLVSIWHPTTD